MEDDLTKKMEDNLEKMDDDLKKIEDDLTKIKWITNKSTNSNLIDLFLISLLNCQV
jgi:hypothetical protein